MAHLKVALVQYPAIVGNLQENILHTSKIVAKARELDADIVLFPELWASGYVFEAGQEVDNAKLEELVAQTEALFLPAMADLAKRHDITLVATALTKGEKAPRNTALVIDRHGTVQMEYSKVHTCAFSGERQLERGKYFPVCDVEGVKIGIMICFDREFPESARILMLNGAEIILVPNACPMDHPRLTQLYTRAFENMTAIALANYPGQGCGRSCAFSPVMYDELGNPLESTIVLADDKEQAIIVVDFDLEAIRRYRSREVWGNAYRNVQTYEKLLDPQVVQPFVRKEASESNASPHTL